MSGEASVADRVHDAFLAALEEDGQVDLAESLRPFLEDRAMPRAPDLADLIAALSAVQA